MLRGGSQMWGGLCLPGLLQLINRAHLLGLETKVSCFLKQPQDAEYILSCRWVAQSFFKTK